MSSTYWSICADTVGVPPISKIVPTGNKVGSFDGLAEGSSDGKNVGPDFGTLFGFIVELLDGLLQIG